VSTPAPDRPPKPGGRGAAHRIALVLTGVVLVLGACRGETTPVEVMQALMSEVGNLDGSRAQSFVCEKKQDRVRETLESFDGNDAVGEAFDLAFDELTFEEVSNDGTTAIVHVSGWLVISFLGQQESQVVDEDHLLIREGKRWVVCDP
jgi:hypothetical protein